jgi:capsular polysaccharide biosynthesis protein
MFAAGGLVGGLGLGVGLVILRELLDRSIRHEGDVAELLNLPTLAFVPWAAAHADSPDMRDSWRNRLRPAPAK